MDDDIRGRFGRLVEPLQEFLVRLDKQDGASGQLAGKIDRQAVMATGAMQAAGQALTALTSHMSLGAEAGEMRPMSDATRSLLGDCLDALETGFAGIVPQ